MRKPLLLVSVLLIATSGLWFFWLSHRWTHRITPGWTWESYLIGFRAYVDPETGELPAEDTVTTYFYRTEVVPDSWQRHSVVLLYTEARHDVDTGEEIWADTSERVVDPRTGQYLNGKLRGVFAVFPRDLEKKTYRLSYAAQTLSYEFETEETVEGLRTYVFANQGPSEMTETYVANAVFGELDVKPDQAIRCAEFVSRYWVEPATGVTIKEEDSCLPGEAVYDLRTGERLAWLARWRAVTAGDELYRLVERGRVARRDYLWASRYTPGLLLLGGLVTLAAGAIGGRKRRST